MVDFVFSVCISIILISITVLCCAFVVGLINEILGEVKDDIERRRKIKNEKTK